MIGIVILSHGNLRRTGQLARHLADGGCKVVLHMDKAAPTKGFEALKADLKAHANIRFARRWRCEWGRFELVEASLTAVDLLLKTWPGVSHVCQVSGACIPLRPVEDLQAHLAARLDTDFIEAIPVAEDPWVIGGLSEERFTLYHPFSWRRQRRLFDWSVRVQRWLRIRRKMPEGLKPCIGSQWWCLSRGTLRAILDDPRLPEYRRFFRQNWIPDESFFQTLATKHSKKLVTEPLTFVRFDPQGKPFLFYDDHRDLLMSVDAFFARKVWPGADRLYRTFMGPQLSRLQPPTRSTAEALKRLERARNLRMKGRRGMLGPGRHPVRKRHGPQYQTARPYTVFDGFASILPALLPGLNADERMRAHGALYASDRARFHDGADQFEGNLSANAAIRDYRPEQFLVNLIWSDRRRSQVFCHDFISDHPIRDFILNDPNAQVIRLEEGWIFDLLMRSGEGDLAKTVRQRMAAEAWLQTKFARAQADIMSVPLSTLLDRPGDVARRIEDVMPPYVALGPLISQAVLPDGIGAFLERLQTTDAAPRSLASLAHQIQDYRRAQATLTRKI